MNIRRTPTFATLLVTSLFAQVSAGELGEAASWPEVWGELGLQGYASGKRMAPNGVEFEPIFLSDCDFNLGLLPRKKLYVFLETGFWAQRASAGITNKNQGAYDFSKREFDINAGLAWNVFDKVELRVSGDARNNLNRGTSKTEPSGNEAGGQIEARYYFGSTNIYDVGRLSFVGIGYTPSRSLVGGEGFEFRAGVFAQVYGTYIIPALRSYLYGRARLIEQELDTLRLITFDAGIATRPFSSVQSLEFRVGNELTADIKADATRDLIYGAIRAYYGPSDDEDKDLAGQVRTRRNWPELWGDFGGSVYARGNRIAPNGVKFDPLFMSDFNLNVGLLSRKKVYLFIDSQFWVQRANAAGGARQDRITNDVSQREFDINAGLAWNFFSRLELRVSAYALNNLNRGSSQAQPSGFQDGVQQEVRYYLRSDDIYDSGHLSFLGIGYYPSQTLVGGNGDGFHPGLFARAYGSYDVPKLRSYIYGDARFIAQKPVSPRLVTLDVGLATRPFSRINNLEFRIGNEFTADIDANTMHDLTYGSIRLNFSPQ